MIEVKRVEIRDSATLVPAVALRVSGEDDPLLHRAGFNEDCQIILINLIRVGCNYDPYQWGDRTMHNAHLWLQRHWDFVADGAVLDVEFILGETTKKKESECQV